MEPIGGGATIGLIEEANKKSQLKHPNFFRDTEEVIHDRHGAFRVSLDLTNSTCGFLTTIIRSTLRWKGTGLPVARTFLIISYFIWLQCGC